MKLLFAAVAAVFFSVSIGFAATPKPTVTSIRAFEEPLFQIGGDQSANNDATLIAALQTYQKRASYEDVSALTGYLDAIPQTPWKFSLLANIGIVYRRTGHFSRAVNVWEQAWALGKGEKEVHVQALANQVAAELSRLLSSLGRTERLESLLAETKGRTILGSAAVTLMTTNENLWLMKNRPGDSFKCGAYALESIRNFANLKAGDPSLIAQAQSSKKGFSLTQVRDLSNALKMNYQMAIRQPGAAFITPAVAHWKSGHYAALLKKFGDHYVTKDPTFGHNMMVSMQALEDELDGYFLVPSGPLPSGWSPVADAEGNSVWGRGQVDNRTTGATKNDDNNCGCSQPGSTGMAVYSIKAMLVDLCIQDTPVGYTPPVGPDAHFVITYNQLEDTQPSNFNFFNFGPSWSCSLLSYVTPPGTTGGIALINTRGGGQEIYSSWNTTGVSGYTGYYSNELQSQATLWVTTSGTFERRMPGGSKEVFGKPGPGGLMFLTAVADPQGNSNTLGYTYVSGSNFCLTSVTDSCGLVTTLSYGLSGSGDPFKVTSITDPYNRSAYFGYTMLSGTYQLTGITDVLGITSAFTYVSGSSVGTMTTPYGTTQFTFSTSGTTGSYSPTSPAIRGLLASEPDGSNVYAESHIDNSLFGLLPFSSERVPSGTGFSYYTGDYQNYLYYRDTLYWDKKAMATTGSNSILTNSYIYHFLHENTNQESPVLESEKPPLENRIWYNYPNQSTAGTPTCIYIGSSANPTAVARVLPDGSSQITQYQYNNSANPAAVTEIVDPSPLYRTTFYTYDSTTGIDLTGVYQKSSTSGSDTIATLSYAGPPHCPTSITDAAGQTTGYAYNTQGQVTQITPPIRTSAGLSGSEPTIFGYTSNYLTTITRPLSGAVTTMTYDTLNSHNVNRVKTMSDPESYTLTYSYDSLDRITGISYSGSGTDTFSYFNPITSATDLDLHSSTDRLNRTTTRTYNKVRQLTSITDPLGRETRFGWCSCGSMISLTDDNSNITYFNRDLESRLTSKVYPSGTGSNSYTYDSVGRLWTYMDQRGDTSTYAYNADNTVSGIDYTLGTGASTPNLSYSYDTYYPRVTSEGGISLSYLPPGSLGAGKPLTVTNTLTGGSAAITYTYDEWGRVVGRNIDGANSQTVLLDSLGRVSSMANPLASGSFAYTYTDPTNRIGSVIYPNGQSTVYNYFGITGDERLQEIKNLTPASAILSKFDYTRDAAGKIVTWQQQTDSNTPTLWTDGYDAADQLTSAVQTSTAATSPPLISGSYGYDPVGNMTTSVVGGISRSPSYNALNQLTSSTPSGSQSIGFTGSLNALDTVTINGAAATVNGSNCFSGLATLTPGTTGTVSVVATDSGGNSRTNHYQTTAPAQPSYSGTYDADGNELTTGAGQNYTWDVKSELVTIAQASGTSQFTFDALGHRTSESVNGTLTKQWVWDGDTLAEERNASNTVTKRFYLQGEQISGTTYYYTRDHLGSIREMTTGTSGAIQARYDYDPYGRATQLQGTLASDFQYAGYYAHAPSGLYFPVHRPYDPITDRWLSRDPLGEAGGINLYDYVRNDPINLWDPNGENPILAAMGIGAAEGAITGAISGAIGGFLFSTSPTLLGALGDAGIGAITGSIGGAAGGAISGIPGPITGGIGGAVGAMVSDTANSLLHGKGIPCKARLGMDAAIGGVPGIAAGFIPGIGPISAGVMSGLAGGIVGKLMDVNEGGGIDMYHGLNPNQ